MHSAPLIPRETSKRAAHSVRRAARQAGRRVYTRYALPLALAATIGLAITAGSVNTHTAALDPVRRLSSDDGCPDSGDFGGAWPGIILMGFVLYYIFLALAIVCDDYFCASLDLISEHLGLSPDVAGATFLAAGSSAPELFVSFADNVLSDSSKSIGIGTIVGSAIFNVLVIIGITAFFAGSALKLDWRPMARDAIWYTISIVALLVLIIDKEASWYDGLILFILYFCYIYYMTINQKMVARLCPGEPDIDDIAENKEAVGAAAEKLEAGKAKEDKPSSAEADEKKEGENGDDDDDPGPYWSPLWWPSDGSVFDKLWFIFTFPINLAFKCTIPDSRYEMWQKPSGFWGCFGVSILWIAFLSHYTVECATNFGCLVGMPLPLMALTIVAAGTSVPDAIGSILVAKQGEGDMAVSNAIGSNVFDILMGLGFPYFLGCLVYDKSISVATDDLIVSMGILFGVLLAVVVLLTLSKWVLTKQVGGGLLVLYVAYVIYAYVAGLA